jgi:hypothetical protein
VAHFAAGVVPGDGIFTTWSYRAGAGRAEAFLLNPQSLPARTAYEWGVVAEVVPNGTALSRARGLAELYLKAPEVTRRATRIHFIQPLKERSVREVGYVAIDMFVVASASFRLLYVMIILGHARREIVRTAVTEHPTAAWLSRQVTEAFPWDTAPSYLLRDRDASYGSYFCSETVPYCETRKLTTP